MSLPESGYLMIADLTGYTAYLSSSDLEHAPTIAGDLLETIVGRLEPPFRLAKFEGDAAFLYVEDDDPAALVGDVARHRVAEARSAAGDHGACVLDLHVTPLKVSG